VQKSFTVHFDTGLSEFFLPGSTCANGCNSHTLYDPDASSTSKALETPFHLEYVNENELSGTLYTDDVTVAGLTATTQTMGVVRTSTFFTPLPLTVTNIGR
jgi:cathepsin D